MASETRFKDTLFGLSIVVAFLVLIATPAHAQVAGATLSGTVMDPSGAVIPNAKVTVTNASTGVTRRVTSNRAGLYLAPNLLPGSYSVNVSAPGFATQARKGIELTVGANQVLNVTLQVGKVTHVIEVTSAAPTVQLGSSAIGAVVGSTTIRGLPLNGRSWSDLAKLEPGVNAILTQPNFGTGPNRGNRGFGSQVTISGQRPVENNYRLDGVSLNDYSNGAPGSVLGGNLGVDAIQEFSVLTTNYSAEYGKTAGGVVNAITKSGTNRFHGDAYEFIRNDAFDAANFFDNFNNTLKPPFRRNQFGASLGGPIQKNKTFFFGDYEGIRQFKGVSTIDTVPSPKARSGELKAGTVKVDPSAQKYLAFWPLPNGPLSGNTGIFSFVLNQVVTENYWTTRIDHTFSGKDSMFGTYMYDVTPYNQPDALNNVLFNDTTNRQFVVLEETHIFSPHLVNAVRAGYNRDGVANNIGVSAINPLAADKSLGAVPGENAAQVNVSGIAAFTAGVAGNSFYHFFWNSFQGYDDAFYTRGAHSIKFGGAVERMDLNMGVASSPAGSFTFASLQNFLTNKPSRFTAGLLSTLTRRGLRQTLFGTYLQDDWRARPGLTLNLGLRWEMATVPTEVQGKLVNLPTIDSSQRRIGSPLYNNPTYKNFEPRVGFAWDPFHSGKTAVRGGFGVFDVLPLPYQFILLESQAAPFFVTQTIAKLPPGSFYAGALSLATSSSSQSTYIPQDAKRNYVMQYNFNVQRQLAPSLTAMAGFIGSRGVHQPFRSDDIQMVMPTRTSAGYLFPSPIGSGALNNPNFSPIRGLMWAGDSFYDALEAQVTKTMSRGLQLQGSFTWGKSIDTGSSSMAGNQFSNSISALPFYDLRALRGPTDYNVGRTFVLNALWNVPTPKSWRGPARWILGGWEAGGILTASDGVPFTPVWGRGGDPLGSNSSNPWDFPDRLTGPGCQSLINPGDPNHYIKTQCFTVPTAPSRAFYNQNCDSKHGVYPECFNLRGNAGRNILTSPGLADLDFALYKNVPVRRISENFMVQFRAEAFNLLNRANFAPPANPGNTEIFDASGAPIGAAGLLTSTTTDNREIQFALKLTW